MKYVAKLTREGKNWLAEFPDCPGKQQVAKLENPSANPSLVPREAVAKGAGAELDVKLVA